MAEYDPDEFFTDIVPITREVPVIHGEIDVSSGTLTYRTCRTNADRIRAMSDEGLAVLLEGCICPSDPCKKVVNRERQPDKKRCQSCWLDWLQSPAGGDGDG